MERKADVTAEHTIELLETRLQDIEYVLLGHRRESANKEDIRSIEKRLKDLERSLDKIVTKSRFMQDLLKLYARHPHFFHPPLSEEAALSLDTSSKLSIVLVRASLFPETSSRLVSIHETPPPAAELSSQVIAKVAQAEKVEMLQESQSREIAILKQRSASILQRWYALDILQTGEYWADLEDRVEKVEQSIRQTTLARESG